MAVTDWFIDGNAVKRGSVRHVASREGWHNVNPLVGQNLAVPNRPGEIWVPKKLGAGAFSLDVWLWGRDDQAINDEWDRLLRLAVQPHRLVIIEKRLPNQSVRFCRAELYGAIQPTTVGRTGMRAQLQFRIPSGVWQSQRTYEYWSPARQTLQMPSLAESTAPIDDMRIVIYGPITNATITCEVDGRTHRMEYNDTIPAGSSLTIHTKEWDLDPSGFTANPAALSTNGSQLMVINPSSSPHLRLDGSGIGADTRFYVELKAAYIS